MPQISSKTLQSESIQTRRSTATQPSGIAIAPPDYGIDFVDRQSGIQHDPNSLKSQNNDQEAENQAESPSIPLQAKLTIGAPGDRYEQEADRTARRVMEQLHSFSGLLSTGKEQAIQQKSVTPSAIIRTPSLTHRVQRKDDILPNQADKEDLVDGNEPEEKLDGPYDETSKKRRLYEDEEDEAPSAKKHQPLEEEMELNAKREAGKSFDWLQNRLQSNTDGVNSIADLEASIHNARGNGQPLADNLRRSMEQAFGADFSDVRLHTDSTSDRIGHAIQARAFTTGRDVFFRRGEYQPNTTNGQELLAHELTHVVQQNSAIRRSHLLNGRKKTESGNLWANTSNRPIAVSLWVCNATDNSASSSPVVQRVKTRAQQGKLKIPSYKGMAKGGGGGHPPVPKNQWQTQTVNGVNYKFWNAANGTLEFTHPKKGGGPALVAQSTVNIDAGGGKMKITGRSLRNTRYQHFLVANCLDEGIAAKQFAAGNQPANGGSSPANFTWHHHANQGKMELIDRDVHGAFGHHGGFSIWGS